MKKTFSRLFGSVRKRIAAGAILAVAVALPVATSAASMVNITAETTVSNATQNAGTMNWTPSANAAYNEVVAVQVVYNNTEDPSSDKVANNLRVKINIPTTPGTSQKITTVTKADNSNTVNGSATVNLNRADAYLQYIPGTATWKYADTANGPRYLTKSVSDDVVLGADGLVLHNEGPCQSGSIVVQARVMVPGLTIDKQVRVKGTTKWATSIDAKSGDTLQYLISYKNTGNSDQSNVVVADKLPKGMSYVAGTTQLANDSAPNGKSVTDGVVGNGIIIGTYKPGANAFVIFDAKISDTELACGNNLLRNIATVQPAGMNYYYNTADVNVTKKCENQPVYSCNLLSVTKGDNRTIKAAVTYTAQNGATLKTVTYSFGDGSTPLTTDKTNVSYQYAKDGTYTITATMTFSVNGTDKAGVTSTGCAQTVTFSPTTPPVTPPTTPPELPNTGAGNVIGVFVGAVVAGTIGYRLFLSRKLAARR